MPAAAGTVRHWIVVFALAAFIAKAANVLLDMLKFFGFIALGIVLGALAGTLFRSEAAEDVLLWAVGAAVVAFIAWAVRHCVHHDHLS